MYHNTIPIISKRGISKIAYGSQGRFYHGMAPLHKHGLNFIPAGMKNRMPIKVWDDSTYPFPNFNGCTVEVWE